MKILKFGAIWCPGCIVMNPVWNDIKKEKPSIVTVDFDYDVNEDEVSQWNIGNVLPVAIFVDDENNELTRLVGEQKKDSLIQIIEAYEEGK